MSGEQDAVGQEAERFELIFKAIAQLDRKIEVQNSRVAELEKILKDKARSQSDGSWNALQEKPYPENPSGYSREESPQVIAQENAPLAQQAAGMRGDSLEENIGGKWFARIGLIALVLGISFFLKYAFDNDWIGVTGRVMIGIFAGLGLLAFGEKVIRRYANYGQMVTGGGIAILYLSLFSAYNYYHLINSGTAFLSMVLITAIGIGLSLRYDAFSLMTTAIAGGFLTPILASSGQNNQIGLFSYMILLDAAILTISFFKRWHGVSIIGLFGTAVLTTGWIDRFYTENDLVSTMFFLTLLFIIFSITSVSYNVMRREKSTGIEQLLSLVSGLLYFSGAYGLMDHRYHAYMALFAMVLGIHFFIQAYLVRMFTAEDENLSGFLAFLTVGLVTLAIPIQFEGGVVTVGWAIEAVLLMMIGARLGNAVLVMFGSVISVLAFIRFTMFDLYRYDENSLLLFNKVFGTALVLIAVYYVTAYMLEMLVDTREEKFDKKNIIIFFIIAANVLTIIAGSKEISQHYQRQIIQMEKSYQYEMRISAPRSGGSVYRQDEYRAASDLYGAINKLRNKSSIMLSIFWLVYSIVLIGFGMVYGAKGIRIGGLVLLLLAILKLFFVDLWSLGSLYRIISSISLGVVLLLISYAYQKYGDKIRQLI